ncbi:MAG: ATP-binding protein [Muribaculaceae bacterium]|nr:ATP-binding protein [Muribaculaceae bacterium]
MIYRDISEKVRSLAMKFPVVTLTGVRQSGKSTLLKNMFPDYRYVSLEDPDFRKFASDDARGFLDSMGKHVIIDEVQRVPDLFSYIQGRVDAINQEGMYILSGSSNFLLMESISQSLAGRAAVLKMTPFSAHELLASKQELSIDNYMFTGSFPRIYDKDIPATDYYPSYIQTYVERDVRMLKNITSTTMFMRFLRLCAGRIGQLLNVSSLANECGISIATAQSWLSVLESSYMIYLLKPYYRNFNKRLVKSAKLYFCDTGLASALLGMDSANQMPMHYMRGEIFENMVINECVKTMYNNGKEPNIYFWRDSNNNEVDLLIEKGMSLLAIEIKSGATINSSWKDGLMKFGATAGLQATDMKVIYGGDTSLLHNDILFQSWKEMSF